MSIIKRKYKCCGCGKDRPCILEINQEPMNNDYMILEDLKCILDDTNQTSYNWVEITKKPKKVVLPKVDPNKVKLLYEGINPKK